jgi:hypothetical protein
MLVPPEPRSLFLLPPRLIPPCGSARVLFGGVRAAMVLEVQKPARRVRVHDVSAAGAHASGGKGVIRRPVVAASGTKSRPEHVFAAQTFFIRSFLHFARNALLGLPCRPFASACLEHSSDSAVRGFVGIVVLGAVFGIILPATGGLAVGGGVVCAKVALAVRAVTAIPTRSNLRISLPFHRILGCPLVSGTPFES